MVKNHTLSSGDVLPKDAHVSFAGVPMSMSEDFLDKAEEFDGFRFERLRRNPETDHNGLQFTSSYAGSLHFGHGRYMCPGRFMGSLISKLLLIEFLQRYDLKLKEGARPKNIMFFDMDIPDPKYEVLFRDRKA
jgi:cytochrome P450